MRIISILILMFSIGLLQAHPLIIDIPYPKDQVLPKNLYEDVIVMHNAYSNCGMNYYQDQGTTVHEAIHRLDGGLRMFLSDKTETKRILWILYIGNGKAIQLENPTNLTKNDVIKNLPESMRGKKYDLYLKNDNAPNVMLLVDEWNAYTYECRVGCKNCEGVEDPLTKQSVYEACAEFAIYGTAMAMALKEKDPECWNKSFKEFYIWQVKRSLNLFHIGVGNKKMEYLPYKEFLKGKDSTLRNFMKEQMGEKEYNDLFCSNVQFKWSI